ncbi:pollen-specific leucine-rich repeat extensin-like protein 1 [Trifolium pratense]|uniref:pollen-specific leucine-rich repeat extensin-like protein 1 n=1 Tax=Trifolium pratense TaxID=57577 RepID=UPI001E69044F|nr:pollen-specific leucine-rich repeat extensin-like protein 1 [Trifolium pratense]
MATTAHTQTPSPHTYTLPPPTHTQTPSIHASSAVYPQHAYAQPTYTPPPYIQPTLTPPGCEQPSYPPTCTQTPSTYTSSAVYPHNAYAQQTYRPSLYAPPAYAPPSYPPTCTQTPSTYASSAVYPQNAYVPTPYPPTYPQHEYAPLVYTPSTYTHPTFTPLTYAPPSYPPCSYPPPSYPLSGEHSHKRPLAGKRNGVASTTTSPTCRVTQVVSCSLNQFTPMTTTAQIQTSSPYAYTLPPPTQSPSTHIPLPVYPQHACAPPVYTPSAHAAPVNTPSAYAPPTYPLSGGPSEKVPQFIPMPKPQIQGTQGTSFMPGHPKSSQPEPPELEPFQADKDGIHDAEHLIDSDVEKDSEKVEVYGDGQQIIQPSTKEFLPSNSATKNTLTVIQSLKDDDRANFIKALSENYVWNNQHIDQIESNFLSAVSHYLSDTLNEVRLKGQRTHWISETIWQCLLEHWSSANFQLTYAKEKANMTSDKSESGSISTSQDTAGMENFEATMSRTRSQSNSTSRSMSCNLNAATSLSASGIDGGKKKRCLNDVGTLATNSKEGTKAKRLNISLDNTKTSAASNARQPKPDMVEVLQSLATSSAETGQALKEMMKSQQELLRIIQEEREERMLAHAQKQPQTF